MAPFLMIQEMNRTWKASFLGWNHVQLRECSSDAIIHDWNSWSNQENQPSAIPTPKILTLRPPPTPCPEKKTPKKQNQKHHLGCPQTATLKGLKQAEAGLMSCQQPTKTSPGKFTLLKKHLSTKNCQKVGTISVFLLKAKQLVEQFPTFIFILLKLAPSFFNTLFCWLIPNVKIPITANEKMEGFATHNLHLFERTFSPSALGH